MVQAQNQKVSKAQKTQKAQKVAEKPLSSDAPDADHAFPNLRPKEFREMKKALTERERKNYDRIILLPCSKGCGWYEIAEHSAIMYRYLACAQVKRPPNFDEDDDFYCRLYKYGRIRTRDVDAVRRRLKDAKIYKTESWKKGFCTFLLNQVVSQEKIDEFWKREQERRRRLHGIVAVNNPAPEFFKEYARTAKRLRAKVISNMSKSDQEVIGKNLLARAVEVFALYYELTGLPPAQAPEQWDKILATIEKLLYELQMIVDLGVWSLNLSGEIGLELVKVRDLAIEAKQKVEQGLKEAKDGE